MEFTDTDREDCTNKLGNLLLISRQKMQLLVESGALVLNLVTNNLVPNNLASDTWRFSSHCIVSIRTLSRLKQDFELKQNALGFMLVFLERIRKLEFKLRELDHTKVESHD